MTENNWNASLIHQLLPKKVISHVIDKIKVEVGSIEWDKAWWKINSIEKFTISSAWNLAKEKMEKHEFFRNI